MKRGDLIRYLESHGCVLHREGAKHSVYRNSNIPDAWTSIPRHSELKNHFVAKACKDLGVPRP